jgi:hypothetical protein
MKNWKAVALGAITLVGLAGPAMAKDTVVKQSEVPAAVRSAVASKYPKAKAQHFSKDTEKGKTVYEVVLDSGGHPLEVSLADDGTVLSEEHWAAAASSRRRVLRVLRVPWERRGRRAGTRSGLPASPPGRGLDSADAPSPCAR